MKNVTILAAFATLLLPLSSAYAHTAYGPQLEGFDYPHPVESFTFTSQQQPLSMAYMDVPPTTEANGRTAVLLHGKNFCGATWQDTIEVLSAEGYRVIAPDQIGFCRSSKPRGYQFSFNQLAHNTHALLADLNIDKITLIGHSMGGMLAARFTLNHPEQVEQLVLANPIGLEDWQQAGVPYATIDQMYQGQLQTSYEGIKNYQLKFYYNGQWKPEYDRWVEMAYGMYAGPGKEIVAWNQAQTAEMLFTQPVVHEFPNIQAPTLLLIGGKDRTAPGANRAPESVAQSLGQYPELGRKTAAAIPNATLVEFPELGHSPQVEAPDKFHQALLAGMAQLNSQ
ncbi:alpha/beta fold hydrolase [Pseudomonas neustonica]|uniref:Alpha/beta hydrolase n=1 Tax=Pseudomonas neustonica TaxID=2487346 RepID=A0ABX9XEY6_9PSED|nr:MULTISPECIES: alpha/beta hydrolase [Pseudomonas]MAB25901.1 alpha/beta hydrolase [Pseudomonadales bacterium]MBA6421266.1 alpha/beta hydrolase [Pseudomonas sp. 5Ae-yellow]ROZ80761.1 alpha/beta hydrolase [Pseudomonas sp. SSM44]ROZ82073.1 alpha/beta hydrolase [Pseudomonas neustonica]|tara:strand:- start:548 stop:1561 length:1014 start_codon:yes stop_codon:yes gene_type:complete